MLVRDTNGELHEARRLKLVEMVDLEKRLGGNLQDRWMSLNYSDVLWVLTKSVHLPEAEILERFDMISASRAVREILENEAPTRKTGSLDDE
jgi:hypothetical protein